MHYWCFVSITKNIHVIALFAKPIQIIVAQTYYSLLSRMSHHEEEPTMGYASKQQVPVQSVHVLESPAHCAGHRLPGWPGPSHCDQRYSNHFHVPR